MNEDTLKGQWMQLKGKVREQWGKLTDDDLDQVEGQSEQLIGKIQQRYGVARDEARRQFDAWLAGGPRSSRSAARRSGTERLRRARRLSAPGPARRHLPPFCTSLAESDGDCLPATGDNVARTALERSLLLSMHRRLHLPGGEFAILGIRSPLARRDCISSTSVGRGTGDASDRQLDTSTNWHRQQRIRGSAVTPHDRPARRHAERGSERHVTQEMLLSCRREAAT